MADYGLVSIITPTWACAPFIGETIELVLDGDEFVFWVVQENEVFKER